MSEAIPWILMGWTVLTMWLLAEKHRIGFLSGLASQALWLVFDWQVAAYGLMPLAVVLGVIYVRGWRKWGRTEGAPIIVMRATAYDATTGNLTVETAAEPLWNAGGRGGAE